jgi:hypothetical protein
MIKGIAMRIMTRDRAQIWSNAPLHEIRASLAATRPDETHGNSVKLTRQQVSPVEMTKKD